MNRRDTLKFLIGRHSVRRHGRRARPRRGLRPGQADLHAAAARLRQRRARAAHRHARPCSIHHDNHHNAFIGNLNGTGREVAGAGHQADRGDPVQPLRRARRPCARPVRNNLGGHWNHTFFWELMTPGGAKAPAGDLKSAIDGAFGDFDKMKAAVKQAGLDALRLGLGVARGRQGQEAHRLQHAQPGHPAHGRAPSR